MGFRFEKNYFLFVLYEMDGLARFDVSNDQNVKMSKIPFWVYNHVFYPFET